MNPAHGHCGHISDICTEHISADILGFIFLMPRIIQLLKLLRLFQWEQTSIDVYDFWREARHSV